MHFICFVRIGFIETTKLMNILPFCKFSKIEKSLKIYTKCRRKTLLQRNHAFFHSFFEKSPHLLLFTKVQGHVLKNSMIKIANKKSKNILTKSPFIFFIKLRYQVSNNEIRLINLNKQAVLRDPPELASFFAPNQEKTDLSSTKAEQQLWNEKKKSFLKKLQVTSSKKETEIKTLSVSLASPLEILKWAEKTLPNGKRIGKVTNPNTLHYKTFKPQKGGLFCERIFGPLKDFECACGKLQKNETQIQEWLFKSEVPMIRKFCHNCDVEYTWSILRRYQLGYIQLSLPVTHIWYLNILAILLGLKKKVIISVAYNSDITVLETSQKTIKSLKSPSQFIEKKKLTIETKSYWATIEKNTKKIITPFAQNLKGVEPDCDKKKKSMNLNSSFIPDKQAKFGQNMPMPWRFLEWREQFSKKKCDSDKLNFLDSLNDTKFKKSVEHNLTSQHWDFFSSTPKQIIYKIIDARKAEPLSIEKKFVHIQTLNKKLKKAKNRKNLTFLKKNFDKFKMTLPSFNKQFISSLVIEEKDNNISCTFYIMYKKKLQVSIIQLKNEKNLHTLSHLNAIHPNGTSEERKIFNTVIWSPTGLRKELYPHKNNRVMRLVSNCVVTVLKKTPSVFGIYNIDSNKILQDKCNNEKLENINVLLDPKGCQDISIYNNKSVTCSSFENEKNIENKKKTALLNIKKLLCCSRNYFYQLSFVHRWNDSYSFNSLLLFLCSPSYFEDIVLQSQRGLNTTVFASKNKNGIFSEIRINSVPFISPSGLYRRRLQNICVARDFKYRLNFFITSEFKELTVKYNSVKYNKLERIQSSPLLNSSETTRQIFNELATTAAIISPNIESKDDAETRIYQNDPSFSGAGLFKKIFKNFDINEILIQNLIDLKRLATKILEIERKIRLYKQELPEFQIASTFSDSVKAPFFSLKKKSVVLKKLKYLDTKSYGTQIEKQDLQSFGVQLDSQLNGNPSQFLPNSKKYPYSRDPREKEVQILDRLLLASSEKVDYNSFIFGFVSTKAAGIKNISGIISPTALLYDDERDSTLTKLCEKLTKFKQMKPKLIRRIKLLQLFDASHFQLSNIKKISNSKSSKILKDYSMKPQNSDPNSIIIKLLPVLPADLRPIMKMGDQIAASDLNQLYQKIIYRNDRLKKFLKESVIINSEITRFAHRLLQEAVDNLIDNGKSDGKAETDSQGRILKSLSAILKGKSGRFRQYLLGKRVDYSGRSVIVVGPKLKMHECGLPYAMAIELFLPFLLKRILNYNLAQTVSGAKTFIRTNKILTTELLKEVMRVTPVLLNRAPTLHRLGIQAFQPKLVNGKAILLHPLVCPAFNADFDGDQMAVHVPITVEAKAEALKLMFSRNNLLSPASGDPLVLPSQDMVLGCYYLTTEKKQKQKQKLSDIELVCYKREANYNMKMFVLELFRYSTLEDVLQHYYKSNIIGSKSIYKEFSISEKIQNFNIVQNCKENLTIQKLNEFKLLPKLHIHTPIWVKWEKNIETGNNPEQPLEIRLNTFGYKQEIYSRFLRHYSCPEFVINIKNNTEHNYNQQNARAKTVVTRSNLTIISNNCCQRISQHIRTTPGKIIFNRLIQQSLPLIQ